MAEPSGLELDVAGIVVVLAHHDVTYVLIDGLAAVLHGSPLRTGDADITPERSPDNLERLAAALVDLEARVWAPSEPEGLPFDRSGEALGRADMWNLVTRCGRLDISFSPAGTGGYADLARAAVRYEIGGVEVPVAALLDVIRSKEAAGRDKDRAMLPTLRKLAAHIADEESG